MRVAVANSPPAPDPPSALAAAGALAGAAAAAGAALLLLPQRFAGEAGEPSDGPFAAALRALAGDAGVAIAYGYVERCTGQDYDAVQLVDAGGRAIANYRRAHVDGEREGGRFAPGHWLSAMPLGGRRLGLLCGYDLAFPEAARALRLVGCDLLLVAGGAAPAAARPPAGPLLLAARAAENGCAVAFASADPALAAVVIGPGGESLGGPSAEGALVVADVPAGAAGPRPALLRDRRPRLYQRLAAAEPRDGDAPA